jgi:glycerol uptake facilitator-like aquaporin
MSAGSDGDAPGRGRRVADLLEREPVWAREFTDPRYEWRRWFSELFGTFLLVLAAVAPRWSTRSARERSAGWPRWRPRP